jgi:hypothetical protein
MWQRGSRKISEGAWHGAARSASREAKRVVDWRAESNPYAGGAVWDGPKSGETGRWSPQIFKREG